MRVSPERLLDTLYREHSERLWRALLAYTGNRDVADDALAEAFAQCLRRGSEVRSPKAWLWKASFRIAAAEMARRSELVPLDDTRFTGIPEDAIAVVVALGFLSPNQRACLVLHDYAGYRAREIAGIVGCSTATVRVHVSRGRKRLRELTEVRDD